MCGKGKHLTMILSQSRSTTAVIKAACFEGKKPGSKGSCGKMCESEYDFAITFA